jgi:methionyl-tRNA synthetase
MTQTPPPCCSSPVNIASVDYSEERVAVLLNADLADTLGNLLQRVTAQKLNPDCFRDERDEPATTVAEHQERLESEWNKIPENKKDRAFVDHLKNLTGGHY